jgi:uncharacterized protein YfiM (DUF2279 family)
LNRFFLLICASLLLTGNVNAQAVQDSSVSIMQHPQRKWAAGLASGLLFGGMVAYVDDQVYHHQRWAGFHSANDWDMWLQMDKAQHAWIGYSTNDLLFHSWLWAGLHEGKALLFSGTAAMAILAGKEYIDGRHSSTGWSWSDIGADIFGTGLFTSQQILWHQQKIRLKYSAWPPAYPMDLAARADALYRTGAVSRLIKDYNGQIYWASFSLQAVTGIDLPPWLALAVGYGAEGLLGQFSNVVYDTNGSPTFDRRDIKRARQLYLAPDIDLSRIRTRSRFLRTAFTVLNTIKFPAPALELSNGKLKVHLVAF